MSQIVPDSPPRAPRTAHEESTRPDVPQTLLAAAQQCVQERAAGGSPSPEIDDAWADFYRWVAPLVHRFIRACHVRADDCDDCAQNVWAEIVQKLPSFHLDRSRGQFRQWLFSIVHNQSVDLIRRRASHRTQGLTSDVPADAGPGPEERAEQSDVSLDPVTALSNGSPLVGVTAAQSQQAVELLLNRLEHDGHETERRVLELRWLDARSVDEIAHELGLTPEQVWVYHYRAKKRLRQWVIHS